MDSNRILPNTIYNCPGGLHLKIYTYESLKEFDKRGNKHSLKSMLWCTAKEDRDWAMREHINTLAYPL